MPRQKKAASPKPVKVTSSSPGDNACKAISSTPGDNASKAISSTPGDKASKTTSSSPGDNASKITSSSPGDNASKATSSSPGDNASKATSSSPGDKASKAIRSISGDKASKATSSTQGKSAPKTTSSTLGMSASKTTSSTLGKSASKTTSSTLRKCASKTTSSTLGKSASKTSSSTPEVSASKVTSSSSGDSVLSATSSIPGKSASKVTSSPRKSGCASKAASSSSTESVSKTASSGSVDVDTTKMKQSSRPHARSSDLSSAKSSPEKSVASQSVSASSQARTTQRKQSTYMKPQASAKDLPRGGTDDTETNSKSPGPDTHSASIATSYGGARPKIKGDKPNGHKSKQSDDKSESTSDNRNARKACPSCHKTFQRLRRHRGNQFVPKSASTSDIPNDIDTCQTVRKTLTELKGPRCWQDDDKSESTSDNPDDSMDSEHGIGQDCGQKYQIPVSNQGPSGFIPTLDIEALQQKIEQVVNSLRIEVSSNPNRDTKKFFDAEVKLIQKDMRTVEGAIGPLVETILTSLEECTGWKWDNFNAGSSYDGTKVRQPDEVDVMFTPKLPKLLPNFLEVSYDKVPRGFCFLQLKPSVSRSSNPDIRELQNFLCEDGYVSSRKFREKAFEGFKTATASEHSRQARRIEKVTDIKPGCPSYPVKLAAIPSENELKPVFMDLVPGLHLNELPQDSDENLKRVPPEDVEKIRKNGFDVIPKECHTEGYEDVCDCLWRLSFSRAEKQLTKFADKRVSEMSSDTKDATKTPVTCRKVVLRVLKRMLEICKGCDNPSSGKKRCCQLETLQACVQYLKTQLGYTEPIEKFSTYQIRTLMWTEFHLTCPGIEKWVTSNKRTRLMHALGQLKKMMTGQVRVYHFFIPDLDIMAEVPRHEREFLYIMFSIAEMLF